MTCSTDRFSSQALADRLFQSAIHALEMYGVHLGRRLGLYAALAAHGPSTPAALARAAGIAPRYAREWLEQQAVAGLLQVDDPAAPAEQRRYALHVAHAAVLVDEDHPAHVAPLASMLAGIGAALPQVAQAYRTGAGVPYSAFGADFRDGQAGINRPAFLHDLPTAWIGALPDVRARLESARPPARVADVGCGAGWSTIALARAYPHADVVGYDSDLASIDDARRNASERGVRARFEARDAVQAAGDGPFDLILVLETLHDMARPTEALAALRRALSPSGAVLVADERVAERFVAPGDATERMMYGWSITHCLPSSLADAPSDGIGTAIRPDTVRACASAAGFARCEVLPIESELFRFYRLDAAL